MSQQLGSVKPLRRQCCIAACKYKCFQNVVFAEQWCKNNGQSGLRQRQREKKQQMSGTPNASSARAREWGKRGTFARAGLSPQTCPDAPGSRPGGCGGMMGGARCGEQPPQAASTTRTGPTSASKARLDRKHHLPALAVRQTKMLLCCDQFGFERFNI